MPQFRLSPDVLYRDLEGQAVILDLSSGLYFGLNEVGTRIWTLIGEGRTVADIAQILSHEYAADASSIERDVRELADALLSRNLIS
jgi:Coenzyme PQQ synthesis protein D (PqqD)